MINKQKDKFIFATFKKCLVFSALALGICCEAGRDLQA